MGKRWTKWQPGTKHGLLTVLEFLPGRKALCQCSCGNKVEVYLYDLRPGRHLSCGCMQQAKKPYSTRLRKAWDSMHRRCTDEHWRDYSMFGGRGIVVCEEWKEYKAFELWALTHGYSDKEKTVLRRINIDGNYTPDNCEWVSKTHKLKTSSRTHQYKGVCLAEFCRNNDINYANAIYWYKKGEESFTRFVEKQKLLTHVSLLQETIEELNKEVQKLKSSIQKDESEQHIVEHTSVGSI